MNINVWAVILFFWGILLVSIVESDAESIDNDPSSPLMHTASYTAVSSQGDKCTQYDAMIDREARRYAQSRLLAALAKAAMRQESGCRTGLTSPAGARGLMQVMYATAKGMGYRGSRRGLFNARTSIKYGVKYFDQALRACRYKPQCAAAYYNGGPRTMTGRWFSETRKYVPIVMKNMRRQRRTSPSRSARHV